MATGDIIKKKREEKGLTQEQLATAVLVKREYITQIERGTKIPPLPLAKQIADVFGCTVDELCK